jgi:hypothetical protein
MKTFYGDDIITPIEQQLLPKNSVETEDGKPIKNKYVSLALFGGMILLFAAFGFIDINKGEITTGIVVLSVCCLFFVVLIAGFIQTSLKEKTAQLMSATVNPVSTTNRKESVAVEQLQASNIPQFKLEVYEQNELPDIAYTYNEQLTEEKNIFGIRPLKIFYFFNFFSADSWEKKTAAGWQRHGPVFHLGSPEDVVIAKAWKSSEVKKIVNSLLITSPEKLSEAIDNVTYKPLPPKTKGLLAENYISGAYPTNLFLCADAIWQQCVELLFNKTDFSIIDAGDYTTERGGLQWEIHQIINHIATENFVVLINKKTDLVALAESFRNAWKHMSVTSPNNKEHVNPVRFIFYQPPDRHMAEKRRKNFMLEPFRQQTFSNDRIISFVLRSKNV